MTRQEIQRVKEIQRRKKQRKIMLRCITITAVLILMLSTVLLIACQSYPPQEVDSDSKQEVVESKEETVHTNASTSASDEEPKDETPKLEETTPTEPEWKPDEADVEAIAKTLWGECRGVPYTSHKAAVVWCILNRVDQGGYFGSSIIEVVSKPRQFSGYSPDYPVDPELKAIAEDVLMRWHLEKEGEVDVGRVLPKGYCYFVGDGKLNYFTNEWQSRNYWDWSLPNPYES